MGNWSSQLIRSKIQDPEFLQQANFFGNSPNQTIAMKKSGQKRKFELQD